MAIISYKYHIIPFVLLSFLSMFIYGINSQQYPSLSLISSPFFLSEQYSHILDDESIFIISKLSGDAIHSPKMTSINRLHTLASNNKLSFVFQVNIDKEQDIWAGLIFKPGKSSIVMEWDDIDTFTLPQLVIPISIKCYIYPCQRLYTYNIQPDDVSYTFTQFSLFYSRGAGYQRAEWFRDVSVTLQTYTSLPSKWDNTVNIPPEHPIPVYTELTKYSFDLMKYKSPQVYISCRLDTSSEERQIYVSPISSEYEPKAYISVEMYNILLNPRLTPIIVVLKPDAEAQGNENEITTIDINTITQYINNRQYTNDTLYDDNNNNSGDTDYNTNARLRNTAQYQFFDLPIIAEDRPDLYVRTIKGQSSRQNIRYTSQTVDYVIPLSQLNSIPEYVDLFKSDESYKALICVQMLNNGVFTTFCDLNMILLKRTSPQINFSHASPHLTAYGKKNALVHSLNEDSMISFALYSHIPYSLLSSQGVSPPVVSITLSCSALGDARLTSDITMSDVYDIRLNGWGEADIIDDDTAWIISLTDDWLAVYLDQVNKDQHQYECNAQITIYDPSGSKASASSQYYSTAEFMIVRSLPHFGSYIATEGKMTEDPHSRLNLYKIGYNWVDSTRNLSHYEIVPILSFPQMQSIILESADSDTYHLINSIIDHIDPSTFSVELASAIPSKTLATLIPDIFSFISLAEDDPSDRLLVFKRFHHLIDLGQGIIKYSIRLNSSYHDKQFNPASYSIPYISSLSVNFSVASPMYCNSSVAGTTFSASPTLLQTVPYYSRIPRTLTENTLSYLSESDSKTEAHVSVQCTAWGLPETVFILTTSASFIHTTSIPESIATTPCGKQCEAITLPPIDSHVPYASYSNTHRPSNYTNLDRVAITIPVLLSQHIDIYPGPLSQFSLDITIKTSLSDYTSQHFVIPPAIIRPHIGFGPLPLIAPSSILLNPSLNMPIARSPGSAISLNGMGWIPYDQDYTSLASIDIILPIKDHPHVFPRIVPFIQVYTRLNQQISLTELPFTDNPAPISNIVPVIGFTSVLVAYNRANTPDILRAPTQYIFPSFSLDGACSSDITCISSRNRQCDTSTGICECMAGFTGPLCYQHTSCQTNTCEAPFINVYDPKTGLCGTECVCPHRLSGIDCTEPVPPCNGKCGPHNNTVCNTTTQQCECDKNTNIDSWEAEYDVQNDTIICKRRCPCQNEGVCEWLEHSDTLWEGRVRVPPTCNCPKGYGGKLCQTELSPSSCPSTTESNNDTMCDMGTFVCDPSQLVSTCSCLPGWDNTITLGPMCALCSLDNDLNPNRCSKQGTHRLSYSRDRCRDELCICSQGWTGSKCDHQALYGTLTFTLSQDTSMLSAPGASIPPQSVSHNQAVLDFLDQALFSTFSRDEYYQINQYVSVYVSNSQIKSPVPTRHRQDDTTENITWYCPHQVPSTYVIVSPMSTNDDNLTSLLSQSNLQCTEYTYTLVFDKDNILSLRDIPTIQSSSSSSSQVPNIKSVSSLNSVLTSWNALNNSDNSITLPLDHPLALLGTPRSSPMFDYEICSSDPTNINCTFKPEFLDRDYDDVATISDQYYGFSNPDPTQQDDNGSYSHVGLIVGLVIGCIVLIAIAVVVALLLRRKKPIPSKHTNSSAAELAALEA